MPLVQKMSFSASGTPARGGSFSPLAQLLPRLAHVFVKHGVVWRKFAGLLERFQRGFQLACARVG